MPLKRWDHGGCITYGSAGPVVKVRIPAALVTTFGAAGAFRDGIAPAGNAAGRPAGPRGKGVLAGCPSGVA